MASPSDDATSGVAAEPPIASPAGRPVARCHPGGRRRPWRSAGLAVWSVLCLGLGTGIAPAASPDPAMPLWSGPAPGETGGIGPERDTTTEESGRVAGRRVMRLGQVSEPTLQVFRPPAGQGNGAAVLVCPGGAYNILALDLEGTEVCEWLNSVGVTGVLLKYRVPRREGREKHAAPLQDAQRAMSLIRHQADRWGIDPRRIGVLGFSAGGHLAAAVSTAPERTYPKTDAADEAGCRPNFTILVYPGYLTVPEEGDRLAPEIRVTAETPPAFVVMTADDPVRVENAFHYALGLRAAGVPMEVHVYPKGGHGYGLRRTDLPVTRWPDRAVDWLNAGGWLSGR